MEVHCSCLGLLVQSATAWVMLQAPGPLAGKAAVLEEQDMVEGVGYAGRSLGAAARAKHTPLQAVNYPAAALRNDCPMQALEVYQQALKFNPDSKELMGKVRVLNKLVQSKKGKQAATASK